MLRTADKRLLLADGRSAQLDAVLGRFSWVDVLPPVAGYTCWLDASDVSTVLIGSDATTQVKYWVDKTGNGYSAEQARDSGISARPVTGTRTINGLNALDFDGSGDGLVSSLPSDDRTSTSIFVALADNISGDYRTLRACWGGALNGGNHFRVNQTTGQLNTDVENLVGMATQSNAAVSTGTAYSMIQVLTASDVTHYLGSTSETDSNSSTFTAGRTTVFGARGTGQMAWDGLIGEFIYYPFDLTSTEVGIIRSYLGAKWGVA